MIHTASQRVLFLESSIEEMNGTNINYVDIHSGDESVFLAGTYGFANGLKTGAKANVNGISSAVANTFTLGYVDSVEPWTVYEDDINGGYGTALMFARGGGELLLIAAPTGIASLAAHGGRMGKACRLEWLAFWVYWSVIELARRMRLPLLHRPAVSVRWQKAAKESLR